MNDKIKLGILSIRDDTTIMDISGKHSDYIFSTRDNPALFDASNDAADDLIVLYEGSPTFEQEGGSFYGCRVQPIYPIYPSYEDRITELYVTIAGHEEIVIPKNTYTIEHENTGDVFADSESITIFGEMGTDPDLYPMFTNYPIAIDSMDNGYLSLVVPEPISGLIIKAHASELNIPEEISDDDPPNKV